MGSFWGPSLMPTLLGQPFCMWRSMHTHTLAKSALFCCCHQTSPLHYYYWGNICNKGCIFLPAAQRCQMFPPWWFLSNFCPEFFFCLSCYCSSQMTQLLPCAMTVEDLFLSWLSGERLGFKCYRNVIFNHQVLCSWAVFTPQHWKADGVLLA